MQWQLEEKKKAFLDMTEEQKKEAKAKAGKKGTADRQTGAAKSSELVIVNIACSAPDKVVVSLDYPALSA